MKQNILTVTAPEKKEKLVLASYIHPHKKYIYDILISVNLKLEVCFIKFAVI